MQTEIDTGPAQGPTQHQAGTHDGDLAPTASAAAAKRQPWPADLPAQMRAVADALLASPGALDETALAGQFTGRGAWKKRLPQILQTLEALGRARAVSGPAGPAWRAQ